MWQYMAAKKPKKPSIGKLKAQLWKKFALWVKLSHSPDGETCECYTCGKTLTIGTHDCQAGHWLPKKGYPYHHWNEDNVRPQCFYCNMVLLGNSAVFERKLKVEIGEEAVEEMFRTRELPSKRNLQFYAELLKEYDDKLKDFDWHWNHK